METEVLSQQPAHHLPGGSQWLEPVDLLAARHVHTRHLRLLPDLAALALLGAVPELLALLAHSAVLRADRQAAAASLQRVGSRIGNDDDVVAPALVVLKVPCEGLAELPDHLARGRRRCVHALVRHGPQAEAVKLLLPVVVRKGPVTPAAVPAGQVLRGAGLDEVERRLGPPKDRLELQAAAEAHLPHRLVILEGLEAGEKALDPRARLEPLRQGCLDLRSGPCRPSGKHGELAAGGQQHSDVNRLALGAALRCLRPLLLASTVACGPFDHAACRWPLAERCCCARCPPLPKRLLEGAARRPRHHDLALHRLWRHAG
mmetsp:Transcript_24005/g.65458  ORF Transcript_24005/g.65458 Transcript_24005/m.65458 type:complete len:317 (-) Transcript_24005:81-1031(-)